MCSKRAKKLHKKCTRSFANRRRSPKMIKFQKKEIKQPFMKTVHVVAAIIRRDDKILATQRGYGEYKDGWEFPGGKINEGETPEEAIAREIKEELDADIKVGDLLVTVEHDYKDFHLSMQCFWAELKEDSHIELLEHEAAKWLSMNELNSVEWLPADVQVVDAIAGSK